jgi:hypothetical protein
VLWFHESSTPEWPEILALKATRALSSSWSWPDGYKAAPALVVATAEISRSSCSRRMVVRSRSCMAGDGFRFIAWLESLVPLADDEREI